MHYRILSLPASEEAMIIDFMDNLAVNVLTKQPLDANVYTMEPLSAAQSLPETAGLKMANEKTEE